MSSKNESATPIVHQARTIPALEANHPANPAISPRRSLAKAAYDRREEYTRPQKIRIKIGSWNVAACTGVEQDLKGWFVQGGGVSESLSESDPQGNRPNDNIETGKGRDTESADEIGLYVLGLQEVLDISSATEVLRPYGDPSIAFKWKSACALALPKGYELVAEQQLSGILLLIYASPEIAPTVTSVSTTTVGTGLMGYMGNKGGVVARLVLGDTTRLVFINSHLAAGTEKGSLERRNWDAAQIVQRTRFEPIDHGNGVIDEVGEVIGDEDFAFWFGDLNYRLATMPGEDVRRLLLLHTRNEYDVNSSSLTLVDQELRASEDSTASGEASSENDTAYSSRQAFIPTTHDEKFDPENDPTSLVTTISSLLPHDQLLNQMKARKAFSEGWKEGPIKFLPTYKYDVGSVGVFDSSEKQRAPSWCDRILYRTQRYYQMHLAKSKANEEAAKRDAEMKARGLEEGDDIIFDYDPETDGDYNEYDEDEEVVGASQTIVNMDGHGDRITQEYYTSHQHVLSSDHKPIDTVFNLTYDAVDRNLKKQIQADIAREMDKDENESRPTITLVVDHTEIKDGSAESIDYGQIKYDIPKSHNITVANTGRVPAFVGFVENLASQTQHHWLIASFDGIEITKQSPSPSQHVIEPGETMVIRLTIHVTDLADVRSLNTKAAPLEDVRVLRVDGGRDHFITLKGTWLNSCFGLSLEELIRIPETGIRKYSLEPSLTSQEVKWSAPRELFRLTDALEKSLERAVAEWGMKEPNREPPWAATGWPFVESTHTITAPKLKSLAADVREALDSSSPFPNTPELPFTLQVEALGNTLLQFLGGIDGGIIDTNLWCLTSQAIAERDKAKLPSDPESTRVLVLDVISTSAARSVAFNLITLMLERVIIEIAPLPSAIGSSHSLASTATAAGAILGRVRGTSEDPKLVKRRDVERKFAEVFEPLVFRIKGEGNKDRREGEGKRKEILITFLQGKPKTG